MRSLLDLTIWESSLRHSIPPHLLDRTQNTLPHDVQFTRLVERSVQARQFCRVYAESRWQRGDQRVAVTRSRAAFEIDGGNRAERGPRVRTRHDGLCMSAFHNHLFVHLQHL